MNKLELTEALSKKLNLSKADAERALNSILELISESLSKGEKVTISGFGTFGITNRKEREGVNPKTGARIKIPATKTPKFTTGKALKESVNK